MSKKIKKSYLKRRNDKNCYQFGRLGWCLKEKVPCFGDCTRCTLEHFPELQKNNPFYNANENEETSSVEENADDEEN